MYVSFHNGIYTECRTASLDCSIYLCWAALGYVHMLPPSGRSMITLRSQVGDLQGGSLFLAIMCGMLGLGCGGNGVNRGYILYTTYVV
jgi:hypothetical protein